MRFRVLTFGYVRNQAEKQCWWFFWNFASKISSMSSLREKLKKMKHPVEIPTPAKSEIFICGFYGIIFIKVCCWFQMSIPILFPKRNEFFEKKSTINFYFLLDYYVTISCQGSFYQRNFVEALFHPWGLNLLTDLAYIFQPFVLHWQILQFSSINQVKCLHFQNVTFMQKKKKITNIYLIYSLFMFN